MVNFGWPRHPDIPEGFKVSFNLFPVDFTRNGCLGLDFVQALNTKQFKLVLEITEDEQIATQSAVKHIKSLKSKGFLFAIDDFGVGYSNLGQLQALKVAERTGLEPATPGVTGRYSNQLNYRSTSSMLSVS